MRRALQPLLWGTVLSCAGSRPPASDLNEAAPLHAAVHDLTEVMVYDIMSPPQASRVYAYASIAAYEAARPGAAGYQSLAGRLTGLTPPPVPDTAKGIAFGVAAAEAYLTVGRALTFSQPRVDSLKAAMQEGFRRRGVAADVLNRSVAYGDSVARHVLAWAAADKYKETRGYPKYTVTPTPGRWVPTPPAYMDAVEPNWRVIRPFVLDSAAMFRPEPPHPFSTAKASPFYKEMEEVFAVGKGLTEEQRDIAAFWDCNPYVMHVQGHSMFATKKISPGGHWMEIVGLVTRQAQLDLVRAASIYARTAVALADGFLSGWDEKYRSNLVRPETVINQYLDPNWTPLLQTPPFPEYTSGHSVISNAAAAVLTDELGERFAFADSSEVSYGLPVRSFASFQAAASEAAISRLYGGIHYRRAIEQGSAQGRRVGALVVARVRVRDAQVAQRAP